MNQYDIAVIAGDGIGKEVVPATWDVLGAVADVTDSFRLNATDLPWGCEYYLRHGDMLPRDGMATLAAFPVIFLGAVGFPSHVPDHVSLRGLLIPIRQQFDQYVNLRPIRLFRGVVSPLRHVEHGMLDILCVRENSEGEYAGVGGRMKQGTPDEVALQTGVFTRKGTERILHYAFEEARRRRKQLVSATKSNACQYSMVMWDDICDEVAKDFPDVAVERNHIDALCARFVIKPEGMDVVVGSNLFGDILTDLGAALHGGLGISASANLNPERTTPSMFEPVHGSAPDIAGKNIANPVATMWAGAMMLDFLGEAEAATLLLNAVDQVLAEGVVRTPDLGGASTTHQFTEAVVQAIRGRG